MDESLWPPAFERLRARGKSAGWAFPQVNPGAGEVPQWVREKEERDERFRSEVDLNEPQSSRIAFENGGRDRSENEDSDSFEWWDKRDATPPWERMTADEEEAWANNQEAPFEAREIRRIPISPYRERPSDHFDDDVPERGEDL